MSYKEIVGISNNLMALNIATESMNPIHGKVRVKDITQKGVKVMLGTTLLKEQANFLGGL